MTEGPAKFRPKMYPPPEFPPRKVAAFAKTPPAVFPVLLGLLGLVLALRLGLARLGLPSAPADLLAGLVVPLWAFGILAYAAKLARRPGVVLDDLKVMPARAGLAAATVGGMAAASVLAPFVPGAATGLLAVALALHGALAVLVVRVLAGMPPEAREVNPGWHLVFVGFIVGAPAAVALGMEGLARGLLFATMPVAGAIWAVSLWQLTRRVPPAPLRPMLAIHLAPASLFATVSALLGMPALAGGFAVLAVALLLVLLARLPWIVQTGFSALWGAFTFPLAAAATALLLVGERGHWPGLGLLAAALVVVPWIGWRVLSLWPGGRLAGKTNAAEA
jgi:tellurite resistance protein